jgi:hypothetical protein
MVHSRSITSSPLRPAWFSRLALDVRFTPKSGHCGARSGRPLCAISGHWHVYSITSSARASSVGGTAKA